MKKLSTTFLSLLFIITNAFAEVDYKALPSSFYLDEDDQTPHALITPTPIENLNSWQNQRIKASYLWNKEITGNGVKVAVLDTGIRAHQELNGRVLAGYNFVQGRAIAANTSSDDNGHGTHVAGIIGARNNTNFGTNDVVGVAPEALLIPIKILDRRGSGQISNIARGLDFSISAGTHISNLSLGWGGSIGDTGVANALARAVNAGQLLAIAAGNDGASQPGWPARYATANFANGQIIVVGAVGRDSNDKLVMPSWSNKAGDTLNFYLVAPGVNIKSTYNSSNSSYATLSGTSMATPVVAGAAALIKQGWNLSAQQIANILFTTADDLGDPGIDRVYGRGLLNLERAMSPYGNPTFPSLSLPGVTISPTTLATSASLTPSAYKAALANADLKIAGLDSFGRDFIYDLSTLYATKNDKDQMLSQIMSSMNTNASIREYKTKDSKIAVAQIDSFMLGQGDTFGNYSGNNYSGNKEITLTSIFFSKELFNKQSFAMGMNTNTNRFFGFADTPFEYSGFMARKSFDNPYLGFENSQNFLAYAMPLNDEWRISAGMVSNFDAISRQTTVLSNEYRSNQTNINASMMELTNLLPNNKFTLSIGSVAEQKGILGGSSGPLFGVTESTNTMFLSIKNATMLTKDTWVAASFNHGLTLENGGQNSLVSSTSKLNSQSWSLGLLSENIMQTNDRIGLAISQPLIVTSGNMNLDVPIGLDYDSGIMQFQRRSVSMAPRDSERDFEMTYRMPTSENTHLSLSALYRKNPDNNTMNDDQKILTLSWRNWF